MQAVNRLVTDLEIFARAVDANLDLLDTVRLPPQLLELMDYVTSADAAMDAEDLRHAWRIVDADLPVAARAPHSYERRNETWRRWRGPLTPAEVLDMHDLASPTDPGYRTQLRANTAFHEKRERSVRIDQEAVCGRPRKDGSGVCGALPIYAPGQGRTGGFGCWRHATSTDKTAITEAYAAAIRDHDCPGCVATAGAPCHTGDGAARFLRLVDGEWSRVRSFAGMSVHEARLNLVEVQPA